MKTDSEKLRILALWFDSRERAKGLETINDEVQKDLRRIADKLDQYATQRTAEVGDGYQLPEEGDCFVCGKRTNQFHGNSSLAPVEIPYYDNGVRTKRIYHQGCIQEVLTPLPEPPKNSEDEPLR